MTRKDVQKYWRLFWKFRQLHLMRTLEYRSNFLFWTVVTSFWTIVNIFFFGILSGIGNGIGGWTQSEMLFLLGVFTFLDGIIWSFFYHTMSFYTKSVFNGELSRFLLMPVDAQYILMVHTNSYSNIFRLLTGLVMMGYAIHLMNIPITIWLLAGVLFWLIVGSVFIYTLWFLLSTLAFWVEKLDNINELVPSLRSFWQIPKSVLHGWLSVMFGWILPIALISTVPSEFVLGRLAWQTATVFLLATIVTATAARWFFLHSVKKFTGAGS